MANTTAEDLQKNITNLNQRIATEGIADNAGKVLVAPTNNNVINSNTLQNQGNVSDKLPEKQDNSAQVQSVLAQIQAKMAEMATQREAELKASQVDPLKKAQADYLASVSGGNENSLADYTQAEKDAGIEAKQKEVNDLSSQLNAINAEAQQANLTLEQQAGGKDVTTQFLGRQQQEVSRQLAIKSLPIQAKLASAQGNLQSAQQHLDKMFELKQADNKANREYKNKLAEVVYGFASDEQKKLLDEKIRKENRDYDLQDKNIITQKDYAKLALESGDSALMGEINQLDPASKTFQQDLASLTSKIKESPDTILEREIKKAQLANIYSEIAARNADNTIMLDNNGKVIVKSSEGLKINKELVGTDAYKAITKGQDSLQFLDEFEKTFNKYGLETLPGSAKAELRTKYRTTLLNLKEFFNLGVLNGPDLEVLEGIIPDPTTGFFKKFRGTKSAVSEGIKNMKEQIEKSLDTRYKTLSNQYGDYSANSVNGLNDLQRIYVEQKAKLNPQISKMMDENKDLTYEDIINIITK